MMRSLLLLLPCVCQVGHDVARNLNRQYLMALGSSCGLSLYLDGTPVMSYGATDMCVGWYVKPIKAPKPAAEDEDKDKDDGMLPTKRAAAKRKKAAKAAQSQEQPAEGNPHLLHQLASCTFEPLVLPWVYRRFCSYVFSCHCTQEIATHIIQTSPWSTTVEFEGRSLRFEYAVPHLEFNAANDSLTHELLSDDLPLKRALQPLDVNKFFFQDVGSEQPALKKQRSAVGTFASK